MPSVITKADSSMPDRNCFYHHLITGCAKTASQDGIKFTDRLSVIIYNENPLACRQSVCLKDVRRFKFAEKRLCFLYPVCVNVS